MSIETIPSKTENLINSGFEPILVPENIVKHNEVLVSWYELYPLLDYLPSDDLMRIEQAVGVMYSAHDEDSKTPGKRFRKNGEHFGTHPIAVSILLAEKKSNADLLIAALLHDVVEDTHVDISLIGKVFGRSVAERVDSATLIKGNEAEYINRKYLSLTYSNGEEPDIIYLKLADRLHNMRTIDYLSDKQKITNAIETLEIYAPLARRLGLLDWHDELMYHSYRVLSPENAGKARKLQIEENIQLEEKKEGMIATLSQLLPEDTAVQIAPVSFYPCFQRINGDENAEPLYRVNIGYDACPLSTILSSLDGLASLTGARTEIRVPDSFASLVTPKYAIDIREIDSFNRHHTSIADAYRADLSEEELSKRKQRVLRKLQKEADIVSHNLRNLPHADFTRVIIEEFSDYVMTVYTPAGEEIRLPFYASPLDFAAKVHEELLLSAEYAMINGEKVPIDTPLNPGDTVVIEKFPDQKWDISPEQLRSVATPYAKRVMREWIGAVLTPEQSGDHKKRYTQLLDHGYTTDNLQELRKVYMAKLPQLATKFICGYYRSLFGQNPSISIENAWELVKEGWSEKYDNFHEFLYDCALGVLPRTMLHNFTEAIRKIDRTVSIEITASNVPGQFGLITGYLGNAGINISKVDVLHNQNGYSQMTIIIEQGSIPQNMDIKELERSVQSLV